MVLEVVRSMLEMEGKFILVDIFNFEVVLEVISKGVDILNDVFVGVLDSNMYKVVAEFGVFYMVMYMRGDLCIM